MKPSPLISIFIPVFNSEEYIQQAISSVLAQTYLNYELIIVNDASTDRTADVIEMYRHHPRVKIFHNATNLGVAKNWNRGVELCQGDFITRLNADDLLAPDYVEQVLAVFEKEPHVSMVFSGAHLIYNNHNIIELPYRQSWVRRGTTFLQDLLCRCPIRASSVCVRRRTYDKLGAVIENMDIHEDWEMWVRIAKNGTVGYISKPLIYYRVLNPEGCTSQAIIKARSPVACTIWLDNLSRSQLPYNLSEKEIGWLRQGMYDIVMFFAVFALEANLPESVAKHLQFAQTLLPPKARGTMQARLYARAAEIHFMETNLSMYGWRMFLQSMKYSLPPLDYPKYFKLWARAIFGNRIFNFVRERTVARRKFPYGYEN